MNKEKRKMHKFLDNQKRMQQTCKHPQKEEGICLFCGLRFRDKNSRDIGVKSENILKFR